MLKAAMSVAVIASLVAIGFMSCSEEVDPLPPEEPQVKNDTISHVISNMQYLINNIQAIETKVVDEKTRLKLTVGKLEITKDQYGYIERLQKVIPMPNVIERNLTDFAIAPAADGTILTFAEWDQQMKSPAITTGTGGKFQILYEEYSLFLNRGINPDVITRQLPKDTPTIVINGTDDFISSGIEKINEYIALGIKNIQLDLKQNIPVDVDVMNILNSVFAKSDVNWFWTGNGKFIPTEKSQPATGRGLAYVPVGVGSRGERFFVSGADGAIALDEKFDVYGGIETDTLSISRVVSENPLRAQKIFVNLFPYDLSELSMEYANEAKRVDIVVPNGRNFELENANVKTLKQFETLETRFAYYNDENPVNDTINRGGANWPFRIVDSNGKYTDPIIKSMNIGRNDTIAETNHWIIVNGKEVNIGNGIFNMIEKTYMLTGKAPTYNIDGNQINILWTRFQGVMKNGNPVWQRYASSDFWPHLADMFETKKNNAIITITDEWFTAYSNDANGIFSEGAGPQPRIAREQMAARYNLNLVVKGILPAGSIENVKTVSPHLYMRIPGGWVKIGDYGKTASPPY